MEFTGSVATKKNPKQSTLRAWGWGFWPRRQAGGLEIAARPWPDRSYLIMRRANNQCGVHARANPESFATLAVMRRASSLHPVDVSQSCPQAHNSNVRK